MEKSSDTKERLESNKNLVSKLENEHHQQKEHVSQLNSELKDTYKELEESKRSIVQLGNERIHVAHMKKQIAACHQENDKYYSDEKEEDKSLYIVHQEELENSKCSSDEK